MTATSLTPPTELINLSGISWQTYETLLEELSDQRLRLTYNRGNLEIMAPSPEHELGKEVLGRFVETFTQWRLYHLRNKSVFLNIPIPEIARFSQQAETMDY